jgi:hypothetical protein
VTTNVTLTPGHDVAYFTRGQDAGGCAGAMSYYTADWYRKALAVEVEVASCRKWLRRMCSSDT